MANSAQPRLPAGPAASGAGAAGGEAEPRLQRFTDGIVSAVFLWAFPHSVRPNHLTVLRFILIPVVLMLLALRSGLVGTRGVRRRHLHGLYRRRHGPKARSDHRPRHLHRPASPTSCWSPRCSPWWPTRTGSSWCWIMLAFIAVELVLTAVEPRSCCSTRSARPANTFGKAKMVFQSIALYLFLLGGILELQTWMRIG